MSGAKKQFSYSKASKKSKVADDFTNPGEEPVSEIFFKEIKDDVAGKLPEEIWLQIFEKLDFKDMLTCLWMHHSWRNWLLHTRSMLFFPKLAPLILEQLNSWADVLNLRKVCRSWKLGVDRSLENRPSLVQFNDSKLGLQKHTFCEFSVNFLSIDNIQNFLDQMKSHPGNPIPARSIKITSNWLLDNEEDVEERARLCRAFWVNAIRLLQTIGLHVYVAEIFFGDEDSYILEWIEMEGFIRNCFLNLPNVKRLDINGFTEADSGQIKAFYVEHPLNQLIALETLELAVTTTEMIKTVIKSCCVPANMKRLSLSDERLAQLPDDIYDLSHLEVLRMDLRHTTDLERFKNTQTPPSLREVSLKCLGNDTPDFHSVFSSLELFARTIEHADIELWRRPIPVSIAKGFKINLPNLKTLKLSLYNGPLDPFLLLNSLVHLEISDSGWLRKYEGSVIDYVGFEDKMYESNLWDLFPTLGTFKYSACKYGTRSFFYYRGWYEQYRSEFLSDKCNADENESTL